MILRVRDNKGNVQEILAIKGEKGDTYTLTETDKAEIAKEAADMVEIPEGGVTEETDPTVPAWAKAQTKPTYTKSEVGLGNVDNVQQYSPENPPPYPVISVNGKLGVVKLSAPDVGADASGTASSSVSAHNTSEASHNDIRLLISGLTSRLNAIADSDDTTLDQLSEIVAYIKANKGLIDSITTEKVNVADIINNLTTSANNKPLSAKMGVELKALIDAIKIPASLPASDVYAWAKQPNKPAYTADEVGADVSGAADSKVSAHNTSDASHNDIRLLISGLTARLNAIADSDDTTLDQLSEIVAYIKANKSLIDSITTDKVNVADIINNLTTSVTNKPLSANMGVELKALIDAIKIPTSLPASDVPSWAKQSNKPSYTAKEVGALSAADISLGIASDGLIYIFVDGTPVGMGIPQGQSGDVFGYVDENNTIVLNGNLADGTYSVKYEMDNGTVVNVGNMVLDSNVYYSVTSTLTNCTINNSAKTVVEGGSYAATITAKDGYELKSVTVTMGGSPVSVSGGSISIASVTGDIVITAVAEEVKVAEPVTVDIALTDGIRIGSDGTDRTQAGYCATPHIDLTAIPKPCTIHLTKAYWCDALKTSAMVRVYAKNADNAQLVSDINNPSVGGNYFTVVDNSGGTGNDVTVTITSADVGYIRFSGYWAKEGVSDSRDSFAAANTKATLTYTPAS